MKKIKRINLGQGMAFAKEEAKKLAGEAMARAIHSYKENESLAKGTLLLNLGNTFIQSETLDKIVEVANVITVTKMTYDAITVEVLEEEPASDSEKPNTTK